MKKLLLISLLLGAALAADDKCIDCICKQESGCKAVGKVMDVGSYSIGYYQIKLPYYKDCGKPDVSSPPSPQKGMTDQEKLEAAWARCADDLDCSTKCVKAYINKYQHKCPSTMSDCEKAARLHNGGPGGCGKTATDGYWKAIKKCYD